MKKLLLLAALAVAGGLGAGRLAAVPALPSIPLTTYVATNAAFGALGDGVHDNTTNLQNAINAMSAIGGGTVELPGPGVYLCGPLTLQSKINLQVDAGATLKMLPYGTWPGATDFLSIRNLHDVELSGAGTIDGSASGGGWWSGLATDARPLMVAVSVGHRILIQNLTLKNPPKMHLSFKNGGGDYTIRGITINTPLSPNTDGMDLMGTNCLVQDCNISDGDDDIALGSSTGYSSDILVTNCNFGLGHGVSIGSYTSSGMSNLTVINCTFNGTENGIRMKSDNDRGGLVQNLAYLNITMTNMLNAPIIIYSYYNEVGTPTGIAPADAAAAADPLYPTTPVWQNILISNLTASVASGIAGIVWGRPEMPVANLTLDRVNITAPTSFDLYNIAGLQVIDSQINVTTTNGGPSFLVYNTDLTLSNSVPATNLVTLDGLPGDLNDLLLYNTQAAMTDGSALGDSPLLLQRSALFVTNDLTLGAGNEVDFVLGTNAFTAGGSPALNGTATVAANGNLTLNSTLNFFAGDGFNPHTNYLIFTDNGALSGTPVVGAMPYGFLANLITSPGAVSVGFKPIPVFTNITATATTLALSGTNGTAGSNFIVLASTNAALASSLWSPLATNVFDASGNFSFTLPPDTNATQKYFRLQVP
jgi:polygalacturonase